jgi:hypothetical protein
MSSETGNCKALAVQQTRSGTWTSLRQLYTNTVNVTIGSHVNQLNRQESTHKLSTVELMYLHMYVTITTNICVMCADLCVPCGLIQY